MFLANKFGLKEAVRMMINAGYTAIDISMFNVSECPFTDDYREVAKELLEMADSAGVKFTQAHAPFGPYEKYINEHVPLFPRAFEFCRLLGIDKIVVHPIMPCSYYGNEKMIYDANIEFYRALAPLAKTNGVKIAIENMWQTDKRSGVIVDQILADPYELARMYDDLKDLECFTVCLDLGHVALCRREPEDAIRILGDRLGCLHIHDVDYKSDLHTLPGTSKINWDNVCHALADVGYDGEFNMEADSFYKGFLDGQYELVTKFMADIAHSFADKIESYKK